MASADRPVKYGGWPAGVNNVAKDVSTPRDALKQAVNVDLDAEGKPSRRRGYVQRVPDSAHSITKAFGHMIAVVAGTLTAYDSAFTGTALVTGLSDAPVSYALVGSDLYWSNGERSGRIDGELTAHPTWVRAPGQPSVTALSNGALHAGTYQVALTYVDSAGRESGSGLAVLVDVPAGGGISVTNIPPNADAAWVRIYVSGANGDVLLWAADVALPATSWNIGAGDRGKQLETQFMEPLPPSTILRVQNGRMYAAKGRVLRWSMPLRYGLHDPTMYTTYDADITMFEPIGDAKSAGIFVAAGKRTYFLSGPDSRSWQRAIAYAHGAVAGTSLLVPGSVFGLDAENVAYWIATNGVPCIGLPNGRVTPLTKDTYVAQQDGVRGATVLREEDGLRQLVTSMLGGTSNVMGFRDSAEATIRRHGVTTD